MPATTDTTALHRGITDWFDVHARDLPWRRAERTPWGVMVSEFMLQQTPVVRVLPVWEEWMERWPTPSALAVEPAGEALRAWGRLGYPRRALRLHAAAQRIAEDHAGEVPSDPGALLALPGVGAYTAAAVACFAFGIPETVVDTNIRRVHARLVSGRALPEPSYTAAEARLAEALMPEKEHDAGALACRWNAAVMELGALVCTARAPRCGDCPVAQDCAWVDAGRPEPHYVPKGQPWAGTDRQVRGAFMAVLREADAPVPRAALLGAHLSAGEAPAGGVEAEVPTGVGTTQGPATAGETGEAPASYPAAYSAAWKRLAELPAGGEQRERCLEGLLADGLAHEGSEGIALPH
ncbi:A/G-specific adenine glycosylase [Zafaria sp. Z1313]|uniref:A/G-specific adenine glycosylase n=1 Tax=unclassified Zafaria TaxID=2828765 RepID=UPI002E792867|nr:A/G-specific adenine glycosylase [Zafaria sp. J156]MEE1622089.1 A/G-specific adenine glycosylase [Zafaria sp. J156]